MDHRHSPVSAPSLFITREADRLALAWALLIALLSLNPLPEMVDAPGGDKLHHLIAYGLLSALALLKRKKPSAIFYAVLAILVFGAAIEWLQPLVNRHAEVADLLANAGGTLIGGLAVIGMRRYKS